MTNKPGNPMNYKEVSPVTTIWLRFLLFFQFVQNRKEIKVEITDVFELFSFLNISHSRTSTVRPFRRIRFLSCHSRQRIFRIRNGNNDLSFRMSSLFQTKLALSKSLLFRELGRWYCLCTLKSYFPSYPIIAIFIKNFVEQIHLHNFRKFGEAFLFLYYFEFSVTACDHFWLDRRIIWNTIL